ncbi:MAG: hypothetical protein LBN36_05620, partial [Clostridiales Family XIII bacterium]|nr:hypothetical protein [Clostridiales Family XIII bacterium]
MYCKTCGSLLDDSDAVCSVCGTLVSKSQTADAAEVKDPVSEDPFRERSADQIVDPVPQEDGYRKFDFAWDNASFPTGEAKKIEDVEFKWNSEDLDSEKESLRETIGTAVREKEAEAVAVKRQEEATTVFEDDTFHFRPDPEEEARFHFNKKNEEFQELLDQEFEKIQERQTYIEEERNRINADVMKAEVETPASLISGDDVIKAAEERISGFLERADREMLEAIEQRVKDKIESLGIPETPEPEAFTLEPEPELVAGLESELEPEPEPVTEPESAPEAFTLEPEPEPVAGLESAPEPELESVPDTSASTIEEPTPPESPVVVAEPVPAEPLASKETPVAKEEPIFDDFVSGLYGENVAGLFSPLQSGAAEARTAGPDFIDSDFAA